MTRWKALPHTLDPRARQLVVRLRELKDRSGLSGAALASRTGYSRSSWDRYLNGRTLPPAEAVEALARVCGEEPARLLALRDVAVNASEPAPARAEGEPAGEGETDTADDGGGDLPAGGGDLPAAGAPEPAAELRTEALPRTAPAPVPWPAIVLSSVTTAAVMLAGLLLLAPWDRGGAEPTGLRESTAPPDKPYTGPVHPQLGEFVFEPGREYECAVRRDKDDGLLYAGYSRTHTELIEKDASRWSVVEAQCLVAHHGITPGAADGSFGNNTERAVLRLQQRAGIAVDGKVGPDTWKVLRSER